MIDVARGLWFRSGERSSSSIQILIMFNQKNLDSQRNCTKDDDYWETILLKWELTYLWKSSKTSTIYSWGEHHVLFSMKFMQHFKSYCRESTMFGLKSIRIENLSTRNHPKYTNWEVFDNKKKSYYNVIYIRTCYKNHLSTIKEMTNEQIVYTTCNYESFLTVFPFMRQ